MKIETAEDYLIEIDKIYGDDTVHATKEEIIEIMVAFAKQFIDLAAENIFNKSLSTEKHYNKQSILYIKELIK